MTRALVRRPSDYKQHPQHARQHEIRGAQTFYARYLNLFAAVATVATVATALKLGRAAAANFADNF